MSIVDGPSFSMTDSPLGHLDKPTLLRYIDNLEDQLNESWEKITALSQIIAALARRHKNHIIVSTDEITDLSKDGYIETKHIGFDYIITYQSGKK